MSSKINSGNTTNDQDHFLAPDAAFLDNVNTRAKAVLECVEKLRDLNALSVEMSAVEPKLDQGTAEPQAKAKAKKAARFLKKVEGLVTRVQNAVNDSSHLLVDEKDYQKCQKDLKSLRRLAASTYAKAAGYAALATLVGLFIFATSPIFGIIGLALIATAYERKQKNMSLSSLDKFVIKTNEAAIDFTLKVQRSFKLASSIGLFGGMRHQAKKAIEAGYQPEAETPKKTK